MIFEPTKEQRDIIGHDPSAFISACPGAGKTRVMVERARAILGQKARRGIAFLSFTNAAVTELGTRLRSENIVGTVPFPNFIGTFDSFLWQFLVAPFGLLGSDVSPKLIPDKDFRTITPFHGAREMPLYVFDRRTGAIIPKRAQKKGFSPKPSLAQAYATAAMRARAAAIERGELDFEDAREMALARCKDPVISARLKPALAGRFSEIIVDEAQDCNPVDLEIIGWLRDAGIPTKLICDPHQSIYEFRGGVTEQLFEFKRTFEHDLSMRGNFRSAPNICKAITALRPEADRKESDEPLGKHMNEQTPVHILAYPAAQAVPSAISAKMAELANALGIDLVNCPILAATRATGARAIGLTADYDSEHALIRLANAVADFHFAFAEGNRRTALQELHHVVLAIEGHLINQSYHRFIAERDMKPSEWRPRIIALARSLRYDPATFSDANAWHTHAKHLIGPALVSGVGSISQRLKANSELASVLSVPPTNACPSKTIHSVKGLEFDGACVVMTKNTAKGILDYLDNGSSPDSAENAREIYVAASRARRLLAIAIPSSQAARLASQLAKTGTATKSSTL